MNKVRAIKEVQSASIGPNVDRVCELLRPCIKMSPGKERPTANGSRFGGEVLLPPSVVWPRWRTNAGGSRRLNFLARICMKDLVNLECGLRLPNTGSLSVFFDVTAVSEAWDSDGWRLIYSDGGDEVNHGPDARAPWKDKSLSMIFSEEWTLPTDYRRFAPDLALDEEYCFLDERLSGEYAKMHHIGGWADEIQDDAGPPPDIRGNAEWQLLLQLASDSRREASGLGWCWGDMGNLYFWITREDLAARKFENVWCGFQCS